MSDETATNKLPPDFWTLAEAPVEGMESLQLIHAEIVSRLQAESPDADTLELMMVERVAFLYIYVRAKEAKKLFAHDRAYKETLQLWTQMAADLRKQRQSERGVDEIKTEIIGSVSDAMKGALSSLPPQVRSEVSEKVLSALEAA